MVLLSEKPTGKTCDSSNKLPPPRKVNCQQLPPWPSFWSALLCLHGSPKLSSNSYSKISLSSFQKENPFTFSKEQFLKTAIKDTYIYCVTIRCTNAPEHVAHRHSQQTQLCFVLFLPINHFLNTILTCISAYTSIFYTEYNSGTAYYCLTLHFYLNCMF